MSVNPGNSVGHPIVVAMATYSGAPFLSKQLDSIAAQTVKPVRIVVTDDRSQDNTVKILEEFVSEVPVSVFVNDRNLGVVANFKRAVSLVENGFYVALSDQDDVWLPNKLEMLRSLLARIDDHVTPAIVYSDLTVVDKEEKVLNVSFWNELGQDSYRHSLQTLLFGNFVTGCSVLMNSAMARYFKEMPIDVAMHDAWLALIAFSFGRVKVVTKPLVLYRKHENNVAHSEAFRKEGRWERRLLQLKSMILGNDEYLHPELAIAEKFYQMYRDQLAVEQKRMFEDFLALKGKSFLQKKLAFRKAFKKYWR